MDTRFAILSLCAVVNGEVHTPYKVGPYRFLQGRDWPGRYPRYADCSGATSYLVKKATGISTGIDTGAIARDNGSKGWLLGPLEAKPADFMLYKNDRTYAAGPGEHVGVFVKYETIGGVLYVWTYESRGGKGYGLWLRRADFWDNSFRYKAVDQGSVLLPTKKEIHEMFRIIQGDKSNQLWLTNWLEKRKIASPDEVNAIIKAGVTDGAGIVHWPQPWVDNIPVKKNEHDELLSVASLIEAIKKARP